MALQVPFIVAGEPLGTAALAAAASLCLACQGGPIDRPIAYRKALSAIRSSVVGGSLGHTRIAMLAMGTGTTSASA